MAMRQYVANTDVAMAPNASTESAAKAIYEISQINGLPLKVPLGKDAWAALSASTTATAQELEKWRTVCESMSRIDDERKK